MSNQLDQVEVVIATATQKYLHGQAIDMSDLAAQVGLSRATLYRRVGNHAALMAQVLARQTEATFRRSYQRDANVSGVDAVILGLERFLHAVVRARPLRAFIARDPLLFIRVVMIPGLVEQTAARMIEAMLREHLADNLPLASDVLAQSIVRVCDSFMYAHLLSEVEPQLDTAIAVIRVLLGETRAPVPSEPTHD